MTATIVELAEQAPPRRPAPQGVTTIIELQALDEELVVEGYQAGLKNHQDLAQTSPSYLHGYLNGLVDGKHAAPTPSQHLLAREYIESRSLRSDVERWRRDFGQK